MDVPIIAVDPPGRGKIQAAFFLSVFHPCPSVAKKSLPWIATLLGDFCLAKLQRWLDLLLYQVLYALTCVIAGIMFPIRSSGSRSVPKNGSLLVLANHQSFLDPPLIGLAMARECNYLARAGLFRFPIFRQLIIALGAIKIERDGVAKEGMRETLRRLEQQKAVLVFPEGTRTPDGSMQPLKPGVLLLIRRSKSNILLAGIAGAHACWPRSRPFPWRGPIWIHFEPWIHRPRASSEAELAELEAAMRRVQAIAESKYRRFSREKRGVPKNSGPEC